MLHVNAKCYKQNTAVKIHTSWKHEANLFCEDVLDKECSKPAYSVPVHSDLQFSKTLFGARPQQKRTQSCL